MENEIEVNGKKYVLKGSEKINFNLPDLKSKRYVIARTYSAGVFAGTLQSKKGKEVILLNARRFFYWKGAASLSELAVKGVKNPDECKFPCPVPRVELTECIELLDVTPVAKKSIEEVPEWKA